MLTMVNFECFRFVHIVTFLFCCGIKVFLNFFVLFCVFFSKAVFFASATSVRLREGL